MAEDIVSKEDRVYEGRENCRRHDNEEERMRCGLATTSWVEEELGISWEQLLRNQSYCESLQLHYALF